LRAVRESLKSAPVRDERQVTVGQLKEAPHARQLSIEATAPLLQSPDSGRPLAWAAGGSALTDGSNVYPVRNGSPILYPRFIADSMTPELQLELQYHGDSRLQYFLLSQIKQHGEVNVPATDVHYERHLFRMRELTRHCTGRVLDVGCDDVSIGAALFSSSCEYVGLDPFSRNTQARVVGVGEYLPFRSESFDSVLFNTSLDHMLDHHQALDEAFRVVKPGGLVVIATLIWTERATLLSDSVHFHHFRDYEIAGAAAGKGEVLKVLDYSYKDNTHRFSRYLSIRKPDAAGGAR
jgi:SAM-dependent methyltransferase